MVFAVYVSLLPFDLRSMPPGSAWDEFWARAIAAPQRLSRTNFLANVLLFVPLGFLLMGAGLVDRPRTVLRVVATLAITAVASLTASLAAEFLQVFAPGRVPSALDVLAQSIGTGVGAVAWLIAGPGLTSWIRSTLIAGAPHRVGRMLTAYAAVWIFVGLAPFDVTVDLGQLARRYRTGDIALVPFAGTELGVRVLWDLLAEIGGAIPLGMFAVARALGAGAVRPFVPAVALGVALVFGMELAQIFIRSHSATTLDAISGALGVIIGVVAARRLRLAAGAPHSSTQALARGISSRALAAIVVWSAVLCAYHWLPFDFAIDPATMRRKLASISLLPFAVYRADLNAFTDVIVTIGLAIPLGVPAAFLTRSSSSPAFAMVWLLAAGAFFGVLEAGQFLLPLRIPDVTDVLLGMAGAYLGLVIGRWLLPAASVTPKENRDNQ